MFVSSSLARRAAPISIQISEIYTKIKFLNQTKKYLLAKAIVSLLINCCLEKQNGNCSSIAVQFLTHTPP